MKNFISVSFKPFSACIFLIFLLSEASGQYMNTAACNQDTCKLPNCYCPSFNIPGNLPLDKTPQFVFFTLDDSMYQDDFDRMEQYHWFLNNPSITDSLGCTIKLSWYALEIWTDFNVVNYISKVGDVSLHTYDHITSTSASATEWSTQLKTLLRDYQELGQVPDCIISGSRAPYLQPNDDYFTTLTELGILFDSSMTFSDKNVKKSYWPFTLDFGVPDDRLCNTFGSCPTRAFPGLWEVPMTEFDYDNAGNCMDPIYDDYDSYMQKMKQNFMDTYTTNKAPRGFYWHWRYFSTDNNFGILNPSNPINSTRVNFFTEFYTWLVTTFPDIIFATERQVIEWMKNPVDYETTKTMPMFQACPDLSLDPDNSCVGGVTQCTYSGEPGINVCGSKCPKKYPGKGVSWAFPNGYNNYLGGCQTFDGINTGEGEYINNNNSNSSSNSSSNESSNGTSNESSNATSNQSSNDTSNESSNATSNGTSNESSNATSNESSNGTSNGSANANATSNSSSNESLDKNHWVGEAYATWYEGTGTADDSLAYGYFCALIYIKNHGEKVATNFIVTVESCTNLATTSAVWGYPNYAPTSASFQMKGDNTLISSGTAKNPLYIGGFCMNVNFDGIAVFSFNKHIRVGVDFFSQNPNCNLPNCPISSPNYFSEPLQCTPSDENRVNWPGTVSALWYEGSGNQNNPGAYGYFCAKIFVSNPSTSLTAKSFVLSFESCPAISTVSAVWANTATAQQTANSFKLIGNSINIGPGSSQVEIGGWCMMVNSNGKKTFRFGTHFNFGLDFYSKAPACLDSKCDAICGNHVVDSGETASNCPIDVQPLQCPSRRFLDELN